MAAKFKQLILDFCAQNQISVPPGFGRNTPSRYAIIRNDCQQAKLIATTWFKVADVEYYIENFLSPELGDKLCESIRILDFKDAEQLVLTSDKKLKRVSGLAV